MTTSDKIIDYINQNGQVTGAEILNYLGISRQALYKHFPKLLASGKIKKIGKPPKVFYSINKDLPTDSQDISLSEIEKRKIKDQFFIITPVGDRLQGVEAFTYWCDRNKLPYKKTAEEYIKTLEKYESYKKNGLISGKSKLQSSFTNTYLDEIFYLDFYSIERFGKTKLGQLLLYAKQSQNLDLMKEIIQIVKPKVDEIINKYQIDGIGFIPPTVKRERQFMKVLENGLNTNLRTISIEKASTFVNVPQKTLNRLEDRIENASKTIIVTENSTFKNILLIDDAVGSGSTLNETAKKIKEKGICKEKIIGLALTGSFKGFNVINEV
ncbi:MAG: hypothetical protein UT67_C0006G0013 [Candidatus Magasanikbacteria bacterium GW2011_GWA2_40_10]|uniref:Uncharacterized protein n=1 Tax=Candidatus Magasanikbacteria bacterium GW2011_GWA2_40_10 TaxID=1619037 RepID=A0A0G0Q374_9BACT|nr:MAG: hypothetical protein UT67_C0006G0013 [Candidatus Magasanikbacteria bacterium GW2011_GWA2_40_10]